MDISGLANGYAMYVFKISRHLLKKCSNLNHAFFFSFNMTMLYESVCEESGMEISMYTGNIGAKNDLANRGASEHYSNITLTALR